MGDETLFPTQVKKPSKFSQLAHSYTRYFRILPDFLIIGGQKCGTFSLFKYLTSHPNVFSPSIRDIYFFDVNSNYYKGKNFYRKFFPTIFQKTYCIKLKKTKFFTGEATPTYIFHPHAPKRIFETIPSVKLIALLRNPIDRAYSHYQMSYRRGREKQNFESAIKFEKENFKEEFQKMLDNEDYYNFEFRNRAYLERSIYVDQLKLWYEIFPKEQILVLKAEDLFQKSQEIYNKTLSFFDLPSYKLTEFKKFNASDYKGLDNKLRNELSEFFKPHNERLYKFLGRDFGW